MVRDLKTRAPGEDLSGFKLYVTSGINLWERALAYVGGTMFLWCLLFLKSSSDYLMPPTVARPILCIACTLWTYFWFGPLALGYVQLCYHFRTRPRHRFLWRWFVRRPGTLSWRLGYRVEVTVDSRSNEEPENPKFEVEDAVKTKKLFGYRDGSSVCAPITRTADAEAAAAAYAKSRQAAGLQRP
jgi:hypothetical protein